ncbi:O-antigen ligase family protein, partial [Patescibacteria group bacterium]|nr:O-antigen ligase family protein [Patescibacteria group bacterium]
MGAGKFLRKAFEFTLLLTLFAVPLIFSPIFPRVFIIPKNLIFQLGTLAAACFLILSIIFNQTIHFVRLKKAHKRLIFLIAALFILILLSSITSGIPSVSLWGSYFRMQGFIVISHYFLFGALIFTFIQQHEGNIKKLLRVIIISAVLSSLYAIAQKFSVDTINWDNSELLGRVFGTLSHPNMLAQYLVVTIPLTLTYLVAYRSRSLVSVAFLIQFAALILTQGRTSAFALIIAILVFIYFAGKVKQRRIYFRIAISLFMIFIILVGGINIFRNFTPIKNIPVISRLVYNESNLRSLKVRGILWTTSLPLIIDNPLLGHGADTLKFIYPRYKDPELNKLEDMNASADRTHSELLDFAIFFGLPALFIYLVILGSLALLSYNFIKHHKNYNNSIIILGLLSSLVAYFFSTLLSFSLTTHYMLLSTLIGSLIAFSAMNMIDDRLKFEWEFNRLTGPISIIAIIVLSFLIITQVYIPPIKADLLHKEASILLSQPDNNPLNSLSILEEAARTLPAQSEYAKSYAMVALNFLEDEELKDETKLKI